MINECLKKSTVGSLIISVISTSPTVRFLVNICYGRVSPPIGLSKRAVPCMKCSIITKKKIENSNILQELELAPHDYFVVSLHREENIDSNESFHKIITLLNGIAELYKKRLIFSTHPRTRKRIERENVQLNPLIAMLKPFGFSDYNHLQMNSYAVLSDSGNHYGRIIDFKFSGFEHSRGARTTPKGWRKERS